MAQQQHPRLDLCHCVTVCVMCVMLGTVAFLSAATINRTSASSHSRAPVHQPINDPLISFDVVLFIIARVDRRRRVSCWQ